MIKLRCYTLFDITKTNITNKKHLNTSETEALDLQRKRNTQCNLDTIIQVISLRAQPEDITEPIKAICTDQILSNFGFLYHDGETQYYWFFDFSVNYKSVFSDGTDDLGSLYSDCDSVPMLKNSTDLGRLPLILDTSPELRNIYFEIMTNG